MKLMPASNAARRSRRTSRHPCGRRTSSCRDTCGTSRPLRPRRRYSMEAMIASDRRKSRHREAIDAVAQSERDLSGSGAPRGGRDGRAGGLVRAVVLDARIDERLEQRIDCASGGKRTHWPASTHPACARGRSVSASQRSVARRSGCACRRAEASAYRSRRRRAARRRRRESPAVPSRCARPSSPAPAGAGARSCRRRSRSRRTLASRRKGGPLRHAAPRARRVARWPYAARVEQHECHRLVEGKAGDARAVHLSQTHGDDTAIRVADDVQRDLRWHEAIEQRGHEPHLVIERERRAIGGEGDVAVAPKVDGNRAVPRREPRGETGPLRLRRQRRMQHEHGTPSPAVTYPCAWADRRPRRSGGWRRASSSSPSTPRAGRARGAERNRQARPPRPPRPSRPLR